MAAPKRKKGPPGWAKTKTFNGKRYTLQKTHTSKRTAETHANEVRTWPVAHLARVVGTRGDYVVYARPKKANDPPKRKNGRKAGKTGTTPTRPNGAVSVTTKGPIKWVSWRPRGRMVVHQAAEGRGWVAITATGNRVRFSTLTALKGVYKGSWHQAGSKAAKTRPKPTTTAKSPIKTKAYTRSPKVPSYTRVRGRLPSRADDGKWEQDEKPSQRTLRRRKRRSR